MNAPESAYVINVDGDDLVAVAHVPEHCARTGVVLIVGGPQYRVGSHRQFVLLARELCAAGYAVMRFDYRGLGDSSGESRDFENIEKDIVAAVDDFMARCGVERVALWGLCDAASAALMCAATIPGVAALILANPWVHSPKTEARVRLRTYYLERLKSRDFWRKMVHLNLNIRDSLGSLVGYARQALEGSSGRTERRGFIERMRDGLEEFGKPVFVMLSGDDLVAGEFRELTTSDTRWRQLAADRITETVELPECNHTFSRAEWRALVERQTIVWLRDLDECQ